MSFETPLPPFRASDPHATFLNSSCLDLLLIEMVPMAYRLAGELILPVHDNLTSSDGEDQAKAAFRRLDTLGHRVGQGLVERFSQDRPRFTETLDVIKFLCKDMWTLVFRKQIDNLKTNHRGVYVLTDSGFKPFARMSMASPLEAALRAQPFLWFPCGLIRGALASMGINATVQAEILDLPTAVFHIKTIPPKT